MKTKISVIIRTFNEARWINYCITSLEKQTVKPDEIIVVDNGSTDGTIHILKNIKNIKVLNFKKKYYPGKMLNYAINKSKNNYILILSAHCVPYNKLFIENLIKPFNSIENIAATYSRQIPLDLSDPLTVRDLMLVYGPESRLQKNDPQFNNASSLISKKIWQKIKFDEKISNLEDRLWASKVIKNKNFIYYAADSIVHHYHGSHHNNSVERLQNTSNVIKKNQKNFFQLSGKLKFDENSILPIFLFRKNISNLMVKKHSQKFKKFGFKKILFLIPPNCKVSIKNIKIIKRKNKEFLNENFYFDEVLRYYLDQIFKFSKDKEYLFICTDSFSTINKSMLNKILNNLNKNFPQILFFGSKTNEPIFLDDGQNVKVIDFHKNKERTSNTPLFLSDRSRGIIVHKSALYKKNFFDSEIALCD